MNMPRRLPITALLAAALMFSPAAWAEGEVTPAKRSVAADQVAPADTTTESLPATTVTGRAESLIGTAATATQGTVGRDHLDNRPLLTPGEILETIPGVVITQHSGSGKANQYYLRGYNLDHGTDFATTVDGMPVNMPSHGHGQGYSDLNFVIPELVQGVDYRKGPYFAENGDFASAGSADMRLGPAPGTGFATGEIGSWGYHREVIANAFDFKTDGMLTVALEHVHSNGPWTNPDGYEKFNPFVRYERGDATQGWSLTAMGYHGDWNSTDQIPQRALDSGLINRYDAINPSDGGKSQRYSLQAEAHVKDGSSETKISGYAFYYDMALYSDFTYFLDDPVNGDQFRQQDRRTVEGAQISHRWKASLGDLKMENLVGVQGRSDQIDNSLAKSRDQVVLSTVRADEILQNSGALYFQNTLFVTEWMRTIAGVRGDVFHFDVNSDNPANSGEKVAAIASPKLGLVLGPWAKTEFYVNGGMGYHSNDARGVMTKFDPSSGTTVDPASPLVRTQGAEIGVRTSPVKGLQNSVGLWALDSDSELVFVGDAGTVEPSRPTRRFGVESENYYAVNRWLTFDADASLSHARFRDDDPAGNEVPGAIESVYTGGFTVLDFHGFFGGVHARYFGSRPLIEDDSVRSAAAFTVNLAVGYKFNEHWEIKAQVFNVLNRRNQDVAYYYTSRLPGEPAGGVDDVHQHPGEPTSFRLGITGRF